MITLCDVWGALLKKYLNWKIKMADMHTMVTNWIDFIHEWAKEPLRN